eukprot:2691338-Amphidinium_carterae.1
MLTKGKGLQTQDGSLSHMHEIEEEALVDVLDACGSCGPRGEYGTFLYLIGAVSTAWKLRIFTHIHERSCMPCSNVHRQ